MARIIPLHNLPVFSIVNPPDPSFPFERGAAFLVHKPKGRTSNDVVNLMRKCLDMGKIGHAGTLDPKATGLLILCCGWGTRTIAEIQAFKKTYDAQITFGVSTPSYDTETKIDRTAPFEHIHEKQIRRVLEQEYSGLIKQTPPMYSALKHNGQPLYKLARQNKTVERDAREVHIYGTRIVDVDMPHARLLIRCSKGTYIRSIAHNLGLKLDSAAHLTALERTGIGHFKNEDALTVDDLKIIFSEALS